MKKYKVCGTYTITIAKEVWANNEDEAIDKAAETWGGIIEYCGNGGCDKLVGVENEDESVAADGLEEWGNYVEELEDDPNHFECPECKGECERRTDTDGTDYWFCEECCTSYDDDGLEVYPEAEGLEDDEDED